MGFNWGEVVDAFIEFKGEGTVACDDENDLENEEAPSAVQAHKHRVTFGLRCEKGRPGGYIRVWGPSADPKRDLDCHVVIERYNGTVAVSSTIAGHLAAVPRPNPIESILDNPVGASCGPYSQRFATAIPPEEMGPTGTYKTPIELVAKIAAAVAQATGAW